jgi:hypothetical protein
MEDGVPCYEIPRQFEILSQSEKRLALRLE